MGAIAEAIVAYAQPLIDQTDGCIEQMNKAMAISQVCWNIALLPEGERDQAISEMRPSLQMEEDEFNDFRRSIIDPMILRHQQMFPQMHQRGLTAGLPFSPAPQGYSKAAAREAYPGTDPYAPCPCESGRKYKFCCKKKGR